MIESISIAGSENQAPCRKIPEFQMHKRTKA